MQISEIMSGKVITVGMDEPISAAARLMKAHNIGAVPVCAQDGRLRGMVTDRDIVLRCIALENEAQTTKVAEIMTRAIHTAAPEDSAEHAARLMAREQVRRLPVTEDGRLVGIVTLSDLARRQDTRMECAAALGSISMNVTRR